MVAWSGCCAAATFSNGWNCNPASLCRDRADKKTRGQGEGETRRFELFVPLSPPLLVPLSLCSATWPQCHVSGGASAVDEQEQRLRACARERRFQILRGADRLTIDLLDH